MQGAGIRLAILEFRKKESTPVGALLTRLTCSVLQDRGAGKLLLQPVLYPLLLWNSHSKLKNHLEVLSIAFNA